MVETYTTFWKSYMNIKIDDFVLEIGSGHNPKTRSDVLCDKLPEDDTERGGKIVTDRPFIAADGQYLPFADKSFDYIICCHVLEHVEDPAKFISEITRVGKRGYIEVPTEIGERLYGWQYHKWFINLDDSGKLLFKRKTEESQFGQLFHRLYLSDKNYKKFHDQNHSLFLIQYEWSEKINYEIVDSYSMNLNDQDRINKLLGKRIKLTPRRIIANSIPFNLRRFLKSLIVKGQKRSRRTLKDIEKIIVCPSCKGQLEWNINEITCDKCNKSYPIRDGIPFLLID